jgi:hypothetical protein
MTWPRVMIRESTLFANRYLSRMKPISFQIGNVTSYIQLESVCDISQMPLCELALRPCRVPADNGRRKSSMAMLRTLDAGVIGSRLPL